MFLFNNNLKAVLCLFALLCPVISHSVEQTKACKTTFLNEEGLDLEDLQRERKIAALWELIRLDKEKERTEGKKQVDVTKERYKIESFQPKQPKLIEAARNGHEDIVSKLLKDGENPNQTDEYGSTALIEAAGNGHEGIVRILLKAGADPNMRTTNGGVTALIWVVFKNEGEKSIDATIQGQRRGIVELLLSHGADPSIRTLDARSVFGSFEIR